MSDMRAIKELNVSEMGQALTELLPFPRNNSLFLIQAMELATCLFLSGEITETALDYRQVELLNELLPTWESSIEIYDRLLSPKMYYNQETIMEMLKNPMMDEEQKLMKLLQMTMDNLHRIGFIMMR